MQPCRIHNSVVLFEMNVKQFLVWSLLMLAYSVGLAHNLVPHHHDHLPAEGHAQHDHSSHQHHHHEHQDHEGHEHVEHSDHFDDGLWDFIVCVLSETELPESGHHHCLYLAAPTVKAPANNTTTLDCLASVCRVHYQHLPEVPVETANSFFEFVYSPPPLYAAPLRGPPAFS